jgi:peptidoglycan/LPS O-acetylase OafA/YrhL
MSEKPLRVYYIDNLRVLLICLVVLVHVAITYGAGGDWYYRDPQTSKLATLVLTVFVATTQAFYMGFFFMVAAYFTPTSLARKGLKRFLGDRFLRLGIPLLFYMLVLNPVVMAIVYLNRFEGSSVELILQHYRSMLSIGPMWFVLNLLLLTLAFVFVKGFRRMEVRAGTEAGPSLQATIMVSIALGVTSFLVRIHYPIGYWIPGLHLMPAYAPQYLAFFAVGILAGEWGWRGDLSPRLVRYWRLATPLAIVGAFAWFGVNQPIDLSYPGGLNWRSFVHAMCEQTFAVGIIVLLLNWFGKRFNQHSSFLEAAAADSYTVYIIHPLVLVMLALCIQGYVLHPLAKFALVAPVALAACFGSAHLTRKLPFARRIL